METNNTKELVEIQPQNTYLRITKLFILINIFFVGLIFLAQIINGRTFTDMRMFYIAFELVTIVLTALSWLICNTVIYSFSLNSDMINVRWKKWSKDKSASTTIDNISAKLVEAGRYESHILMTIIVNGSIVHLRQCSISGWDMKKMVQFIQDLDELKSQTLEKQLTAGDR